MRIDFDVDVLTVDSCFGPNKPERHVVLLWWGHKLLSTVEPTISNYNLPLGSFKLKTFERLPQPTSNKQKKIEAQQKNLIFHDVNYYYLAEYGKIQTSAE